MTLLTKLQRELLAEGNYAAARAMAEADRPRKPRKAIRPRKRRTAEQERAKFEREYGSKERRDWVAGLPCLCGCGRGPCDNAHTANEGKGRKGHHTTIVPLFRACHRQSHRIGVQTFEAKHSARLCGRTLRSWAETIAHAWRLHAGEVVE